MDIYFGCKIYLIGLSGKEKVPFYLIQDLEAELGATQMKGQGPAIGNNSVEAY